jgi:hypothetical protein
MWQKVPNTSALTWEQALSYAESLTLAGASDWRLPNIKELHSISDEGFVNPSVNPTFFGNIGVKKYWSSTSLGNQATKAWYWDTQFGITTYELKTVGLYLVCVRSGTQPTANETPSENSSSSLASIYPNPASHSIHIRFGSAQNIHPRNIQITNILGQIVFAGEVNAAAIEYTIPAHAFSNGSYFLTITENHATQTIPLIIQK